MIQQILLIVCIFNPIVNCLQASDFYVENLPLLPKDATSSTRMHAGYLPVYPMRDGALFFWHFSRKYHVDKPRTVVWLEGGPGASSLPAAWMSIGPYKFQDDNTIVENKASWHWFTHLLFIDQPVGTGFSYVDSDEYLRDLDEVTDQLLVFFDRYIEVFPELLENDIYLAGESYAGQFIPYLARAILQKQSKLKLCGLLIGNGWIDPAALYPTYLPFAVAHQLIEQDSMLYNSINNQEKLCRDALSQKVHIRNEFCDSIIFQIAREGPTTEFYTKNHRNKCINIHNIADQSAECDMNLSLDYARLTTYLNREDVMLAIHVDSKKSNWYALVFSITIALEARNSPPSVSLLPDLLGQIPIVLYNGDYDLVCNHWGTEKMIDQMTWNGRTGFDLGDGTFAPIEPWIVDGQTAGRIRSARNLTYIRVYNASHSVTLSQPYRSRAMLHQFIKLNNTTRHFKAKHNGLIIFSIVIFIVIISCTCLFLYKKYPFQEPKQHNFRLIFISLFCYCIC